MNLISFGLFTFCILVSSRNVFGDHSILIDKLTSQYIVQERALWKKVDTQLILLDRGSLLNEIYREHSRILNNDFGESKLLWSLGIQKYERLINTVLSIDTNIKNIKAYLMKAEYARLTDLAKNAALQMLQSAVDLNGIIGNNAFWADLVMNVTNIFLLLGTYNIKITTDFKHI